MIKRLRRVKKWSGSHVVLLTPSDLKDFGIEPEDEVDISEIHVYKKEVKKKK